MKLHQVLKCPWNKRNFKGDLDLSNTEITKLPDNLSVEGWLDLDYANILSLPDNLSVGGYLSFCGTGITSFPNNLSVGNDLFINNTKITFLPENILVKGDLYLDEVPLTNYPIVHKCGIFNRSIWLIFNNRNLIRIGCFTGTQELAIEIIKKDYKKGQAQQDYIDKVNQCFKMQQELK